MRSLAKKALVREGKKLERLYTFVMGRHDRWSRGVSRHLVDLRGLMSLLDDYDRRWRSHQVSEGRKP